MFLWLRWSKHLKVVAFVILPASIMVLYETHQRFKGHFLNELRVSFKFQDDNGYEDAICSSRVPISVVSSRFAKIGQMVERRRKYFYEQTKKKERKKSGKMVLLFDL